MHRRSVVGPVAGLVVLLAAGPRAAAQGPIEFRASGGVAIAHFDGQNPSESAAALGVAVARWFGPRLGVEASLRTAAYSVLVAIPDCLPIPSGVCPTLVVAPGQVVDAGLRALLNPMTGLTVMVGAGIGWSLDYPSGPTNAHSSAALFEAGLRVHPLRGGANRFGLEVVASRYARTIGDLRGSIMPGVVIRF